MQEGVGERQSRLCRQGKYNSWQTTAQSGAESSEGSWGVRRKKESECF